jgi:hypothetical protein
MGANRKNSFGRTDTINSSTTWTFIDADVDESQPFTVFIDVKQVTQDTLSNPPFLAPNARVIASVELGYGSGVSRTIYDATDFMIIPIAGDHCKVSLTLENPLSNPVLTSASSPSPIFLPNFGTPAVPEAQAQVSVFSSSGAQGFPKFPDFYAFVPPAYGGPPVNSGLATSALVSSAPCRMVGFTAYNPNNAATYLFFASNPTVTGGLASFPSIINTSGTAIVPAIQRGAYLLPAMSQTQVTLPALYPFDRGCSWYASTLPDAIVFPAINAGIRVDVTLARRPIVQVVNTIPSSSGQ